MPRRVVPPLSCSCSPRAVLDSTFHPLVDAVLKDLKNCTRRLHAVLAVHRDELQILERLYYKGKNQHRSALFWRRVSEIRRYGDRIEGVNLFDNLEPLRLSFWGDSAAQTPKALRGSWTHYPDEHTVELVLERLSSCFALVDKMQERLSEAYRVFAVNMQSGYFIQLLFTLVAILSRLHFLMTEIKSTLDDSWSVCHRILRILNPARSATIPSNLIPKSKEPSLRDAAPQGTATPQPDFHQDNLIEEDIGSTVDRQYYVPEPSLIPAIASTSSTEMFAIETLNFTLTDIVIPETSSIVRTTVSRSSVSNSTNTSAKTKRQRGDDITTEKKKQKKKKKDEIDDIFGF